MKLSARNQLTGTVKSVNEGAAIANVELDVNGQASSPRSPWRPLASSGFRRARRSPRSSRPRTSSSPPSESAAAVEPDQYDVADMPGTSSTTSGAAMHSQRCRAGTPQCLWPTPSTRISADATLSTGPGTPEAAAPTEDRARRGAEAQMTRSADLDNTIKP